MCHGNKSQDPAIGNDLEKPQYTDLFIKLPFNIDYKQNTYAWFVYQQNALKEELLYLIFKGKRKIQHGWDEDFIHLCRYFIGFNHQPV